MEAEEIREQMVGGVLRDSTAEDLEDVLLLKGFEKALIGVGNQYGSPMAAIYDFYKLISVCVNDMGMEVSDAVEYLDHNVTQAYVGDRTPYILHIVPEELEMWFDGDEPDTEDIEASA
jgi:hypothetical protein